MIDREQLASELAKTHGIRVDADDPVLVSTLLNHRLLDEATARLDGLFGRLRTASRPLRRRKWTAPKTLTCLCLSHAEARRWIEDQAAVVRFQIEWVNGTSRR